SMTECEGRIGGGRHTTTRQTVWKPPLPALNCHLTDKKHLLTFVPPDIDSLHVALYRKLECLSRHLSCREFRHSQQLGLVNVFLNLVIVEAGKIEVKPKLQAISDYLRSSFS